MSWKGYISGHYADPPGWAGGSEAAVLRWQATSQGPRDAWPHPDTRALPTWRWVSRVAA